MEFPCEKLKLLPEATLSHGSTTARALDTTTGGAVIDHLGLAAELTTCSRTPHPLSGYLLGLIGFKNQKKVASDRV